LPMHAVIIALVNSPHNSYCRSAGRSSSLLGTGKNCSKFSRPVDPNIK
jgi:hypothetical protein